MKNFASQVTVAVISAAVSALGTWYISHKANEIKYLDYNTWSSQGILNQLIKIPGTDSLKVFLNSRQLTNLSEFGVSIVNLGNHDVSDVPIFIELYPNESDGQLNILSAAYFDHNDTQESIEVAKDLKPVYKDGKRYRYVVHTFNREHDFKNRTYEIDEKHRGITSSILDRAHSSGVNINGVSLVRYGASSLTSLEESLHSVYNSIAGKSMGFIDFWFFGARHLPHSQRLYERIVRPYVY